jgi:hypothetical protein
VRHITRLGVALCTLALVAGGLATAAVGSKGEKVQICHGTASEKNPYVLISVSPSAIAGHFDGTAPGHGHNNAPDFVLGDDETDCSGAGNGGGGGGEF